MHGHVPLILSRTLDVIEQAPIGARPQLRLKSAHRSKSILERVYGAAALGRASHASYHALG